MMTPLEVEVELIRRRSMGAAPSGNMRRPLPKTSGWISRTYSSMRLRRRSDWISSPLPRTARSGPSSCLSSATASAASPLSRVEFFQGSGSARVVEATYFWVLSRNAVNGLSVRLGQTF